MCSSTVSEYEEAEKSVLDISKGVTTLFFGLLPRFKTTANGIGGSPGFGMEIRDGDQDLYVYVYLDF